MRGLFRLMTAFILSVSCLPTLVSFTALAGNKNTDIIQTEDNPGMHVVIPDRPLDPALTERMKAGLGFLEKGDRDLLRVLDKAWHASGCGELDTESVVLISLLRDGTYVGKLLPPTHEYKQVTFQWNPNTLAIVHTHPNRVVPSPSEPDEAVAQRFAVPIFTVTRQGMFVYNPVTRKTRKLLNGLDWLDRSRWTHDVYVFASLGMEK